MDIDFEMDESSDMPEFSGHKRRNESSSESDLEDQLTNFEDYQLLDILAENTIKVNDEYVLRIDPFTDIDISTKFPCKILKFSADWDYQDVLSALNRLNRFEYPNLFIFIIEIENAGLKDYENTSKKTKMSSKVDEVIDILNGFAENRPIILQVKSIEEGLTNFYYKDQTHPIFNIINFEQNSDNAFDFSLFLNAFLYGVVEKIIDSVVQRLEANQDCSLILRFLRTLELSENIWCKLILNCAAHGSKDDFFAVLDIPFGSDGKVLSSTAEKWISKVIKEETINREEDQNLPTDAVEVDELSSEQQACSHVLFTESSILLKTIQYFNEDIINLLIKYCTHLIQELPLEHKINISTSAFNNKQFDVLCKLLNISDYPFPDEFVADGIKHMQLVKLIEERKNFKDAINTRDMNAIKNFVKNHPSLKTAYSLENDSALILSILAINFEAYYYLKSQGFLLPEFENLKEAQLSEETLKIANNFMLKQREKNINDGLTNQQKVINILCNKSLIHNRNTSIENEAEYRIKIRKWIEDIYKIDCCVDMLNVAASCEDLKLIFDFESVTVNNVYLDESGSFGTTKALKKWIFIGAESSNSERDQKIKGIIAHEICHYVMYLIFENSGNPYYKYQTKIKEIFENIAKGIMKLTVNTFEELNDECDGIISTVLQLHKNEKFNAELIVRVVHILAQFDNDENLTKIQNFYKELFDFWIKCVLPEIKNFNQKSRKYVRKMNRVARLLEHIKSYKLEFVASKYIKAKNLVIKNNNIVIVTTNVPKLLLIDIYKYLYSQCGDLFDIKNVFIDPVEIRNPEIFEDFKNLLEKTSELNIFVDCSSEACEKLQQVTLNPASHLLFIVINKNQAEKVKQNLPKSNFEVIETEVNYNRNDLDTASQKLLLQTKINFQNNSQISLLDLITKSPSPTKSSTSETTITMK